MKDIDLTPKLLELQQFKPPTIGRYSISSLWGVLNGYDTPEQFLRGKTIDFETAIKMKMGTLKHELCQECLSPEQWIIELKREYDYKDIKLVAKCDAIEIDGNKILEIKTSDKLLPEAKKWHIWQSKMYLSIFGKGICYIVQPVISPNKLSLKIIGEVLPNDKWFAKECEKIYLIHQQLCQINKKTT